MADFGPNLIMPDERAAGVISGSDPYRELELYLEKVNEEFGEVFERWLGSADKSKLKQNGGLKPTPLTPAQCSISSGVGGVGGGCERVKNNFCNGNQSKRKSRELIQFPEIHENHLNSYRTRSLPSKTKTGNVRNFRRFNNIYAFASEKAKAIEKEWSDSLMADFEKLIATELSQLRIDTEKEVEDKTKELSASPNSDSSGSTGSNSSTGSLKRNPKTFSRSFSDGPDVVVGRENGNAILLRVSRFGEEPPRRGSDSQLPPKRPSRIPSPVRIKEFFRSTSPFGRRGKKQITGRQVDDEKERYKTTKTFSDVTNIPPPVPAKRKKNAEKKIPIGLQNFLTKIRPSGESPPLRGESPGEMTSGFNTMDSSTGEAEDSLDVILSSVSTGTQTSPPLSRSSSFTWMSDCSSSIILNTPGSLSDVNDEKSSSSGRSSSSPARLPCENGCGSECDCVTSGSRDSSGESPDSGELIQKTKQRHKCTRKETWEKIRRRHSELLRLGLKSYSGDADVWVRRESVHTQTHEEERDADRETIDEDASDSNLSKWLETQEKPQGLPPRPKTESGDANSRSLPLERRGHRPHQLPTPPLTIRSLPSPNQPSSPSTTSLKFSIAAMSPDLGSKSSSAPVIMKQTMFLRKDIFKPEEETRKLILRSPRSQSERHLKGNTALDVWRVINGRKQHQASSERLRRSFSLNGPLSIGDVEILQLEESPGRSEPYRPLGQVLDDQPGPSWAYQEPGPSSSPLRSIVSGMGSEDSSPGHGCSSCLMHRSAPAASDPAAVPFARSSSRRFRNTAKAFIRRMESFKRRKKEAEAQSEAEEIELCSMEEKVKDLTVNEPSPAGTPSERSTVAELPVVPQSMRSLSPDDSSSYCSDVSQSTPLDLSRSTKGKYIRGRRLFKTGKRREEAGAVSDSEVQPILTLKEHDIEEEEKPPESKPEETPELSRKPSRGGSLNLGKESQRYREKLTFKRKGSKPRDKSASSELTEDSSSARADSDLDPLEASLGKQKHKALVLKWHSFPKDPSSSVPSRVSKSDDASQMDRRIDALSCTQLYLIKKVALVRLTAAMEKYCPALRSAWNWELPKFMKRLRTPDYKDKKVFGVPLIMNTQRTGEPLPAAILESFDWLRKNALHHVGLFRKSGVRSRIQSMKEKIETSGLEPSDFQKYTPFDIADLIKQYFRELPDALFSNKLSETFIAIFLNFPEEEKLEAVQCAFLLLPDEHRIVLQYILEFLNEVASNSSENQMTDSNLAVCLAPSLIRLPHGHHDSQTRSSSSSPKRRKTLGGPDPRELEESRAAHECVVYMMRMYKSIVVVSQRLIEECSCEATFNILPMTLTQLGYEHPGGWRDYQRESMVAFLREARERPRGWIPVDAPHEEIRIARKKSCDEHPLDIWRVSTEIEAPPQELFLRIARDRSTWDPSCCRSHTVERLDTASEIYQYSRRSTGPMPTVNYCLLRTWNCDLPKGCCAIIETSVTCEDATIRPDEVQGVILASRYLIEPSGSGKSRITHYSRVDVKGRTADWYRKVYGHICCHEMARFRDSFKHHQYEGPESKV